MLQQEVYTHVLTKYYRTVSVLVLCYVVCVSEVGWGGVVLFAVRISKCLTFAGPGHAFCPLNKHLFSTCKVPDIEPSKWETQMTEIWSPGGEFGSIYRN